VLAVVRHTIREFKVTLQQLHNDSTTITFHGNYADAAEEDTRGGRQDDRKKVLDRFSTTNEPTTSAEGYRRLWYQSTRKAERDALARANRIQRATGELDELRQRLGSPRSRYRQRGKVSDAVEEILKSREVKDWITVTIEERVEEPYRQARRGRPTKDTRYVKQISTRFDLSYQIDHARIAEDQRCDGVFPRVTNVPEFSEKELLLVYKRQPVIEKRFSQLKTDFRVAPVYLKDVSRIQALLCVYFLVLLVEALLERELRQAMEREGLESLPLYPEDRPCRRPTARRVIDLFADIHRHTLHSDDEAPTVFVTELSALQRRILKLLGVPATKYRA